MAVLTLSELVKRGENDVVLHGIEEATDTKCIAPESHFGVVFANALTNIGARDPILRAVAKTIRMNGHWPRFSTELLNAQYLQH